MKLIERFYLCVHIWLCMLCSVVLISQRFLSPTHRAFVGISPSSGAVLLDGRDAGAYDPHWLRRRVALVSQARPAWMHRLSISPGINAAYEHPGASAEMLAWGGVC